MIALRGTQKDLSVIGCDAGYPAPGPATIAECLILANRKRLATGLFMLRVLSSHYSWSGGCYGSMSCNTRCLQLMHPAL